MGMGMDVGIKRIEAWCGCPCAWNFVYMGMRVGIMNGEISMREYEDIESNYMFCHVFLAVDIKNWVSVTICFVM